MADNSKDIMRKAGASEKSDRQSMINPGAKRFFKSQARKMIYDDLLTHIFAHLIVFVCFMGIVSLGGQLGILAYSLGIDVVHANMFLIFYDVAALFMTVPLCYGVMYFEMLCSEGKKPQASVVFCAFSSSKALLSAYELFFALLFRVFPCFIPAICVWIYMNFYYVSGMYVPIIDIAGIDEIYFALSTLFLLLVFFGLMLSARFFVGVYTAIKRPELSKREAFYIGSVCCHNNNLSIVSLFVSFLPLLLLSMFTVGILFIIYTVPYMMLTFMNMARFLYETEMTDGKTKSIIYKSQSGDAA